MRADMAASERSHPVYSQSLARLNEVSTNRRLRLLTADDRVPPIMWALLAVVGLLLLLLSFQFDIEHPRAHGLNRGGNRGPGFPGIAANRDAGRPLWRTDGPPARAFSTRARKSATVGDLMRSANRKGLGLLISRPMIAGRLANRKRRSTVIY